MPHDTKQLETSVLLTALDARSVDVRRRGVQAQHGTGLGVGGDRRRAGVERDAVDVPVRRGGGLPADPRESFGLTAANTSFVPSSPQQPDQRLPHAMPGVAYKPSARWCNCAIPSYFRWMNSRMVLSIGCSDWSKGADAGTRLLATPRAGAEPGIADPGAGSVCNDATLVGRHCDGAAAGGAPERAGRRRRRSNCRGDRARDTNVARPVSAGQWAPRSRRNVFSALLLSALGVV